MDERIVDAYVHAFTGPDGEVVLEDLITAYVRRRANADQVLRGQGYTGAELAVARDAQRIVVESIRDLVDRPDLYKARIRDAQASQARAED